MDTLDRVAGILIRHGMTVFGGYLIAEGYADAEAVNEVTGGLIAMFGLGLSWLEKRKRAY